MSSVTNAAPQPIVWPAVVDPAVRFQQEVQAQLAVAELERQLQRLSRMLSPGTPKQRRARRVVRQRGRRTSDGYPAL